MGHETHKIHTYQSGAHRPAVGLHAALSVSLPPVSPLGDVVDEHRLGQRAPLGTFGNTLDL